MSPNVWKMLTEFTKFHHFLSVPKNDMSWLNNLFSGKVLTSIGCLLMLRANYRCVQSLNISVDVAKCVENVHTSLTFGLSQKNVLSSLNNLFMATFELTRNVLLWWQTNYRCVQSVNIIVDVAKCVENVHNIHPDTLTFWTVTKNDLSWLNNLFMARFQLNRMSTYVKNKLQMFSVTQHQCRWRQMCGKCSQIRQCTLTFCPYLSSLNKQSFNTLGCPLMLRINYRCVQSLNISVDVI